jgi:hypothetical protein
MWTAEEDARLIILMQSPAPPTLQSLTRLFPGRDLTLIAERWKKVLNPSLVKGAWTRAEDEVILAHVTEVGARDWSKVAESLPGRVAKQCRERWTNHLSPSLVHEDWTPAEDATLADLHARLGNKWTAISRSLPGRSDNDVKNRWNSSLRRRIERRRAGEPEFKKRGRKPRVQTPETPAPQGSPQSEPDRNVIAQFSPQIMIGLVAQTIPPPMDEKSLKENRAMLEELLTRNGT